MSSSNLKSHSNLVGGSPRSVGSSAKIGLVGVLALIVLVVALWDKSEAPNEPGAEAGTTTASNENTASLSLGNAALTNSQPTAPAVVSDEFAAWPEDPSPIADAQDLNATQPEPVAVVPQPQPEPPVAIAPRPTPPAAPRVAGQRYTTKIGDSLWKVAERFYGDGSKWQLIADANGLGDSLPHSMEIVIPSAPGIRSQPSQPAAVPTPNTPAGFSVYTVQPNDSLWKIAERKLGDGARWTEIRDANRDVLGDREVVQVGMKLKIPGRS